ncbi:hypothetical protein ATJ93_2496 [Halopiger aswanensis]|uniref:Uncharacterized protein n=1 Tax=Halopiger aswanensis TaxID=148449 RepID=A0A3R7HY85_9EURY|nr:hypothetical protein ATJ93_2496 [Halopiger aswanensis]
MLRIYDPVLGELPTVLHILFSEPFETISSTNKVDIRVEIFPYLPRVDLEREGDRVKQFLVELPQGVFSIPCLQLKVNRNNLEDTDQRISINRSIGAFHSQLRRPN